MKILLVNKFLFPKGGDAVSTLETGRLLEARGHEVVFWGMKHPANPPYPYEQYFVDYVDYDAPAGLKKKIKVALDILYSREAAVKFGQLLDQVKPDIAHLNNFAHQISPSILPQLKQRGIPAVMTLRDYKIVCPAYSLFVRGRPCQRCENGRYFQCFLNKCVKDSYAKSFLNSLEMYLHHRLWRLYGLVDVYISPSRFLKDKAHEMGFNKEIIHLPNFVASDKFIPSYEPGHNLCYLGRLSREKGLDTLIEAMKGLDLQLKIIGTGPRLKSLEAKIARDNIRNIDFLGHLTGDGLKREISNCLAVVVPSEWYENFSRVILEAFASGKPIIGSRIGGIPEMVRDRITGLLFEPGQAAALAEKINLLAANRPLARQMGIRARKLVEAEFNPSGHYDKLMKIYLQARGNRG